MGIVYLCRDRKTDQPVAVKTFIPEYLGKPGARLRFLQEAGNWIALDVHPNIVRAHRVEQIGRPPQPYIVLDWITAGGGFRNPSLAARLSKGRPLPFGRSLRYAIQITRGMRHACSQIPGLVHRDLKPGNVLIGNDDLARVSDFGLARSYQGIDIHQWQTALAKHRDSSTRAAGTAPYCAPEQWDITAVLDERADIYALGCILFEMLTGQRAAMGDESELREIHLQGRLSTIPAVLPEAVGRLICRCTRVERDERYSDWAALDQALAETYKEIMGGRVPPVSAQIVSKNANQHCGTYRALGRSYLDLGQWRQARVCFEQSAKLARLQGNPTFEAGALHDLGLTEMQASRLAPAVPLLQRALSRARSQQDRLLQADVLSTLGVVRARLGDYDRAMRALSRALKLSRQCGERDAELTALGNSANVLAESGDAPRAVERFTQLLDEVQGSESRDREMEQRTLGNLGATLIEAGKPRKAVAYLERAYALAQQNGDIIGQIHVLHSLCEALESSGDRDRLVEQARIYIELARRCGAREDERRAKRFSQAAIDKV